MHERSVGAVVVLSFVVACSSGAASGGGDAAAGASGAGADADDGAASDALDDRAAGDADDATPPDALDDQAAETGDAGSDVSAGEVPTSPPVDCDKEPERCALCTGKYAAVSLQLTETIRGAWQYNPGGAYLTLPVPGYPCAAFLYDAPVRPPLDDDHWVAAPSGEIIGFSMLSTISASGYTMAQFRYFRSLVFIPSTVTVDSFRVKAQGIDDSVHVVLYNSLHPDGVSPTDAGPSDPAVGACAGNGEATWDFKSYVKPGEVNVVLVVQADMSSTICSLSSVEITANGTTIPLFDCGAPPGGDR